LFAVIQAEFNPAIGCTKARGFEWPAER
jgi:hypothetical protein